MWEIQLVEPKQKLKLRLGACHNQPCHDTFHSTVSDVPFESFLALRSWNMFGVKDLLGALKRFFSPLVHMFLMSLPFEYLEHHGFFINLLLLQQRFSLHCFYVRNIFVHSSRWYYIHNHCYVFNAVFGHCLNSCSWCHCFLRRCCRSWSPDRFCEHPSAGHLCHWGFCWIFFRRSFHQSRYPSWHGLLNWIQSTKWQVDHMLRKALDTCAALVGNVCQ